MHSANCNSWTTKRQNVAGNQNIKQFAEELLYTISMTQNCHQPCVNQC